MANVKDWVSNGATVILTVCAVAVTGAVMKREFFPAPKSQSQAAVQVKDWEKLAAVGTLIGPSDAPVKIVEFADFQCPFCAQVNPKLRELRARYPNRESSARVRCRTRGGVRGCPKPLRELS
jgi:protein-disulfide isomerase